MNDIDCVIVVLDSQQVVAQDLAEEITPGGAGMFTTACSPTGNLPVTHWISSGYCSPEIPETIAETLPDAKVYYDINPFEVLDELGLTLVNEPE